MTSRTCRASCAAGVSASAPDRGPDHGPDQGPDRPDPWFAWIWQRLAPRLEQRGLADHRAWTVAGLAGRVVEVGCGDGQMFAHYPSTVTEVVAVEPEPRLRARAAQAARHAPVPVTVLPGRAEALPVADGSCDAAVAMLVLCSVEAPRVAARELRRVLRPDGQLRFCEHVRAATPLGQRLQRSLDLAWPHVGGGCHTARPTVTTLAEAGLTPQRLERFAFPSRLPTPTLPHVRGIATPRG